MNNSRMSNLSKRDSRFIICFSTPPVVENQIRSRRWKSVGPLPKTNILESRAVKNHISRILKATTPQMKISSRAMSTSAIQKTSSLHVKTVATKFSKNKPCGNSITELWRNNSRLPKIGNITPKFNNSPQVKEVINNIPTIRAWRQIRHVIDTPKSKPEHNFAKPQAIIKPLCCRTNVPRTPSKTQAKSTAKVDESHELFMNFKKMCRICLSPRCVFKDSKKEFRLALIWINKMRKVEYGNVKQEVLRNYYMKNLLLDINSYGKLSQPFMIAPPPGNLCYTVFTRTEQSSSDTSQDTQVSTPYDMLSDMKPNMTFSRIALLEAKNELIEKISLNTNSPSIKKK